MPSLDKVCRIFGQINILLGFQTFNMAEPDIGDHTDIRFNQLIDLEILQMVHAHFDYRDLVVRSQVKQGLGNAVFIIKVSFCFQGMILL